MQARFDVSGLRRAASRSGFWISTVSWAALIVFAVVSVDLPLVGDGTFLGTQLLTVYAPWSSTLHSTAPITNGLVGDTVNSATPQVALLIDAARHGVFGQWNPYLAGGTQLGGLPNSGIYSPLSLPWWILPLSYAPGVVKILEIAVATVGMSLLLRRLRLPQATWPVASLIFVSSGFMVAWTNWPQTRVAAFIPLLFWAVDRAAVKKRLVDAIPVGLVLASMLLGGFPEVTGFALYASGAYALFRAITTHRALRGTVAALSVSVAGLILGLLLSAWQMVPFAVNASSFIDFAARESASYTAASWSILASAAVPDIIGNGSSLGSWNAADPVEEFTYLGVAAIVLIAAAALIRRKSRERRRGVIFFSAMLVACIVIVFAGSPLLNVLQKLPVFDDNPVGRLRCIIGFAAAVVAAFGFASVLDPLRAADELRLAAPARRSARLRIAGRIASVLIIALVCAAVVIRAFEQVPAGHQRRIGFEILASLILAIVATAAVLFAWLSGRQRAVIIAGCLIPVLVAAPAVYVTSVWWPKSSVSTFYPTTATQRFLERNLGEERYASVGQTMLPGSNSYYRLRSLGGHTFQTAQWKALEQKIDPDSFASPTFTTLSQSGLSESITSPLLNRLGVKYVVDDPDEPVLGKAVPAPASTSVTEVRSGGSITSSVYTGPVRGVTLRVPGAPVTGSDGIWLTTTIRDTSTGAPLARTRTWYPSLSGTRNVALPDAGIGTAQAWTATFTFTGQKAAVPVGSDGAQAVIGLVRPSDDGVRIVHTGDATVYRRTGVLNRVRWASSAEVRTSAIARIDLLDNVSLPASTVVLDSRADMRASDAGSTATVRPLTSDLNQIRVSVTASGSGWVVVDDSLRAPGWTATVDGVPTTLVAADDAGGAVHVAAGHHTVVLTYQTPGLTAGTVISLSTIAGLVIAGATAAVVRRRRRRRVAG